MFVFTEILFWIWVVSAIIIAVYLFAFAPLAVKHYTKQFMEQGMVRIRKQKTNWGLLFAAYFKAAFFIFCPVLNTIIALVWVLKCEDVFNTWENQTSEYFCYPDELPPEK